MFYCFKQEISKISLKNGDCDSKNSKEDSTAGTNSTSEGSAKKRSFSEVEEEVVVLESEVEFENQEGVSEPSARARGPVRESPTFPNPERELESPVYPLAEQRRELPAPNHPGREIPDWYFTHTLPREFFDRLFQVLPAVDDASTDSGLVTQAPYEDGSAEHPFIID